MPRPIDWLSRRMDTMSWDVYAQDFGPYKTFEEIPDDFRPGPLASAAR